MQNIPKNIKIIVICLVFLIVGWIGYSIYTHTTRLGKIAVTVDVTPQDSNIEINGERIKRGTTYLAPNHTYIIKIHKDGFETIERKEYISSVNNSVLANLTPVSDEAKKWAQENQDKYLAVEGQGGGEANKQGEALIDKNPITQALPYENFIYSIGYRGDPSDPSGTSIIISIEAPEGSRNAAVQQIRDLGYDPLDYKIEFSDYRNPFAL